MGASDWADKYNLRQDKAEEVLKYCDLFFVYGSLQKGEWNHSYLLNATYVGDAVTLDKYVMGDVGFPYIFPESVLIGDYQRSLLKPVVGELYQVHDTDTIMSLDRLEGEGNHYHRNLIQTSTGDTCWIYEQHDITLIQSCYECNTTEEGEWKWNT